MALVKLDLPPEQADYSYEVSNEVVSIELDGGASRSRRDIVGSPAFVDVSWTLDQQEYQFLRAFYNHITSRGASPFLMDLLIDRGYLEEYQCKFVPDSLRMFDPFGLSVRVEARLEVVPIYNPALDELLYTIGADLRLFLSLEKLVNVDLEN